MWHVPFYVGGRAVAKLHRANHLTIELSEVIKVTGHVVGGACVKHPVVVVIILRHAEIGVDLLLHQVNDATWWCNWRCNTWRKIYRRGSCWCRVEFDAVGRSGLCSSSSPWVMWAWASSLHFFLQHSLAQWLFCRNNHTHR
jgi:hypothetical protein